MYPTCAFEHLGEQFTPATPVALDHPMVALRPDLFTATPPNKTPKRAAPVTKE